MYRFGAALFFANANRFAEEVNCLVGQSPSQVHCLIVDAEAFLAVERLLAGTIAKSHLDALNTTISEFDFEAALKSLDAIAEDLCEKKARD
jgi:hypothetical protein